MYIFFINSGGRCNIFFLLNLIIIVTKKKKKNSNLWVQPNPIRPMWVGLDLCDELGWVEFFFTHHGGLGQVELRIRRLGSETR